ncbi:MAG: SGNH/GDSL hydrolase family protein [Bacillota bacterium]
MANIQSITRVLFVALVTLAAGRAVAAEANPQKATPSSDGKILWYDGKSLPIEGKGWTDTKAFYDRLPAKAEGKATGAVWGLSHHSAGLCIRFTTDSTSLQVRWTLLPKGNLAMPHMPATGVSGVDLYTQDSSGRWSFVGNGRPGGESNSAAFSPPAGQQCLLYLPLYNGVSSVEIGIPKGKRLSVPDAAEIQKRKSIVFYGTSITQGGCASRPGLAFTAIVGRKLNMPVINLGFSGSGKMEPAMADLLAELDASVYVLDCLWNMSPEMVSQRVEPFVKALRAARPDTPILLAEDCSVKNTCPTIKGKIVREIHQKLVADGVKNIFFLASEGMLGEDTEATIDGCHPNDLGMMRQAEAFSKALAPLVGAK